MRFSSLYVELLEAVGLSAGRRGFIWDLSISLIEHTAG
jgi:hypothetical protein